MEKFSSCKNCSILNKANLINHLSNTNIPSINLIDIFIEMYKECAYGYYLKGIFHENNNKDYKQALKNYIKANELLLLPEIELNYKIGFLKIELNLDIEKGIEYLSNALQYNKNDAKVLYQRAKAYKTLEDKFKNTNKTLSSSYHNSYIADKKQAIIYNSMYKNEF